MCTALPLPELFDHDEDSQHDMNLHPDMLTDEGIFTGWYNICCVVMQLTSILKTRAAY